MLGIDALVIIDTSFEMLSFIENVNRHRQLASYIVHGSIVEFAHVTLMSL